MATTNNLPTGGTITSYTSGNINYNVHTFISSSQFIVPSNITCDILVVGGGGGASGWGGGGGGGDVKYYSQQQLSANTYKITVGNGGGGILNDTTNAGPGSFSQFGTLAAANPGNGGMWNGQGGNSGNGNQGIAYGDKVLLSGAGGGAGGTLPDGSPNTTGGPGISNSITGTSVMYGLGGSHFISTPPIQNTGNGGNGGTSGANGVVIIRYITSDNTIAIASASYNYNQQQVANAIAAASASFNFNQIQLLNATNAAIASGSFNFNQQQMANAAASASYNFNQLQLYKAYASPSPVITAASPSPVITAASPSPVITAVSPSPVITAVSPSPVVSTSQNNLNINFTPIVVPTNITSTFVPDSLLNNVAIYQTLSGYLLLIASVPSYTQSIVSNGSSVSTMNYYVCDGSDFINIDINNIILDTPTLINCDIFSNYIIQLINDPSISTATVSSTLGNSSFIPPTCSILCPNGKTSCVIGGICTCCDVARDKNYLGGLSSTETTQLSGVSSRDTIGNLNEIQSRESNDVNMLNKFTATGDYKVSPTIVTIPSNKSLLPRKVSKTCFPNITTDNITTFKVEPIKGDELTSEFTSDSAIDVNYDIDLVQNEIQKPTYLFIIIGVAITLLLLILSIPTKKSFYVN